MIRVVRAGLIRWELDRRAGKDVPKVHGLKSRWRCFWLRTYSGDELMEELLRRQVRIDPPVFMGRYE